MSIKIVGINPNNGKVQINEKPDNVPKGNLGGAGRIIEVDKKDIPVYLKTQGIDDTTIKKVAEKLAGQPTTDEFQKAPKA